MKTPTLYEVILFAIQLYIIVLIFWEVFPRFETVKAYQQEFWGEKASEERQKQEAKRLAKISRPVVPGNPCGFYFRSNKVRIGKNYYELQDTTSERTCRWNAARFNFRRSSDSLQICFWDSDKPAWMQDLGMFPVKLVDNCDKVIEQSWRKPK
jgi:hypothetical protein